MGYGAALQSGYRYALSKGYAFVVQMDSDGQHEPRSIAGLLRVVRSGGADLALGSRFLNGCGYRVPWTRRAGMAVFGAIASHFAKQRITDPTSGFQAMTREVAQLYATDVFPGDYPDADMIMLLSRMGFRIVEVPVTMYASKGASMHDGLRPVYYVFKMLFSISVVLARKLPERVSDGPRVGA
jgi:glycosyltransferase involved in cell wall biosynthesis